MILLDRILITFYSIGIQHWSSSLNAHDKELFKDRLAEFIKK